MNNMELEMPVHHCGYEFVWRRTGDLEIINSVPVGHTLLEKLRNTNKPYTTFVYILICFCAHRRFVYNNIRLFIIETSWESRLWDYSKSISAREILTFFCRYATTINISNITLHDDLQLTRNSCVVHGYQGLIYLYELQLIFFSFSSEKKMPFIVSGRTE